MPVLYKTKKNINNNNNNNNNNNKELNKYLTPKKILYEIYTTAHKLINFFNINKIQYILAQGTLLGVVKYNNLLPWDIDFDILIFDENIIKDIKFIKLMKQLKLNILKRNDSLIYQLCKKTFNYTKKNNIIKKCKLPTYDICILKQNSMGNFYIPNSNKYKNKIFLNYFKYDELFPLKHKKLGSLTVNIPNKYDLLLNKQYKNYKNMIVLIFENVGENEDVNFLEKPYIVNKNTKEFNYFNDKGIKLRIKI